MSKRKWTDDKIISSIKTLKEKGVYLGSRNIQKLYPSLHTASKTYLGSWKQAVILSGYDYENILIESESKRRDSISESKKTENIIFDNGESKIINYKGDNIIVDNDLEVIGKVVVVSGYPLIRISREYVKLHNYVMSHKPVKGGDIVDHINRNPLDNRRSNLRIIPQGKNCKNKIAKGYTRVGNKYMPQISVDGKKIYLGLWETELEAQLVYRIYYLALNGEYAPVEYECVHEDIQSVTNTEILKIYNDMFS